MTNISEKELRKIRHLLFEAMDKKIIEYSKTSDVKSIQEHFGQYLNLIVFKNKFI